MELITKYPKLNKSLIMEYGSTYRLEQLPIDRLIQFVMTLSESEEQIKRKEVNSNEEVNDDEYIGRNVKQSNDRSLLSSKEQRNKKRAIKKETKK